MTDFVSSNEIQILSISEQKHFNDNVFPLTVSPKGNTNLSTWLSSSQNNRDQVDILLKKHKAVLFRGFDIKSHDDFHNVVEATQYKGMEYLGGAAVRTQLTDRVFTANESPPSEKIPFHHELAQTPEPPTHLFFFCELAPKQGGQTPILPSGQVCIELYKLHTHWMDLIEKEGVRYVRIMSAEDDPSSAIGRGWKSTFQCDSPEDAEKALHSLGSSFEWLGEKGGVLKTTTKTLPAVRIDHRTSDKTFFNSLVAAYTGWNDKLNDGSKAVILGTGEPLDPQFITDAASIMNDLSVSFTWQEGDILLLDNRTVMHSRKPFEGPRRILASLIRDPER